MGFEVHLAFAREKRRLELMVALGTDVEKEPLLRVCKASLALLESPACPSTRR